MREYVIQLREHGEVEWKQVSLRCNSLQDAEEYLSWFLGDDADADEGDYRIAGRLVGPWTEEPLE